MIDILTIMNNSFVPLAIITGIALLILGINERYSRVMESIRSLHRELIREDIKNENLIKCYKKQISTLIRMAKVLRTALLLMYIAIFFSIASSIAILLSSLENIQTTEFMIITMIFSLGSLFFGIVFVIIHIFISLNAIEIDLKEDIK
ncbi:MAG: DUF2721 domain-containing protein [Thermoplasmata archaeon]